MGRGAISSPKIIIMTREEFKDLYAKTFADITALWEAKNGEYAGEETTDVFQAFNRAANGLSFHNKREKVAWEFLIKHLQSIKDIIDSDKPASFGQIDEKFNDAITYLLLIKGMCYDQNRKGSDYDLDKIKFNYVIG